VWNRDSEHQPRLRAQGSADIDILDGSLRDDP
jgi:hypothetical protein